MNDRNEENLEDLFEKFGGAEWTQRAVEDIQKAEQVLREHPAPEPNDKLVANIKAGIAAELGRREATAFNFKRIAYKTAVVAAVFIVLAVLSVKVFEKGGGGTEKLVLASVIPESIWGDNDVSAENDTDLTILTAEIEQIEGDMLALQLGETGGNGHTELAELEMELIEIGSDFWKG